MQKWAKVIDYNTKEVEIGIGEDEEYYKRVGMSLMDVEQAYNDLWYIEGCAPKKPEPTAEELKEEKRAKRNIYLVDTDYTQLSDSHLSEAEKTQYREYRQYLRDYTKQEDWWLKEPKTFEDWQALII